jgi:hypothetical protein
MKIYEIITESRQLNESNIFVGILEKLGAAKAFAWLAKGLAKSPKKQAIEEITQAMSTAAEKGGPQAIDDAAVALRKSGVSDDVIEAASKQAKTIYNKEVIGKGLGSLAQVGGKGWQLINNGLILWGIGKPIYDCADGIANAYARNAAGDPEYQGTKLQGAIQIYLDRAVAQILTLWAGRTLVKIVASMPKGFFSAFYNGPLLDTAFNGMTKVGQAAFTAWMVSPQGQKVFAEWIVGSSFLGSTMRGLSGIVGGWAKSGYDLIARQATGQEKAAGTTTPDAAVKQDGDAEVLPAEKPSANSQLRFDPATGALLK